MTPQFSSVLLALVLLAPGADEAQRGSSDRTRDVYVTVVDAKGVPVSGLTAQDFGVREDGQAREVLKAGPATEPIDVALLIDDSQAADPALQHLRDGVAAFIDRLAGKAQIALITFGERPTNVVDYTGSADALKRGVGRIFPRRGAGAYLLEAIQEVSRGLQRRKPARAAIVVVTMEEGTEFSNLYHQTVLKELQASGAALHVLAVGTPSGSLTDEMRNRNMVIADGPERSGGRREQLLSVMAIPDELKEVADELLNQYVVTYGRPEKLIPAEKLEVTVTRPEVTVRAPKRLPARP
jgi:Ca-activated chloride channel family protein